MVSQEDSFSHRDKTGITRKWPIPKAAKAKKITLVKKKKHEGVRGLRNFAQTRLGGEFSACDVITRNSSSRL